MDMIKFIETILCYSVADVSLPEVMNQETLSADILLSKNVNHEAPSTSLNKTMKSLL